jgi:hypothetical protein
MKPPLDKFLGLSALDEQGHRVHPSSPRLRLREMGQMTACCSSIHGEEEDEKREVSKKLREDLATARFLEPCSHESQHATVALRYTM